MNERFRIRTLAQWFPGPTWLRNTLCLNRQFYQSLLKVTVAHVDMACDALQVRDQVLPVSLCVQVPAASLQSEHLGSLWEGEGGILRMTHFQVEPLVLFSFRNASVLQILAD